MKTERDKEEIIVSLAKIIREHELVDFHVSTPAVLDIIKEGIVLKKPGNDIYIELHLLRR